MIVVVPILVGIYYLRNIGPIIEGARNRTVFANIPEDAPNKYRSDHQTHMLIDPVEIPAGMPRAPSHTQQAGLTMLRHDVIQHTFAQKYERNDTHNNDPDYHELVRPNMQNKDRDLPLCPAINITSNTGTQIVNTNREKYSNTGTQTGNIGRDEAIVMMMVGVLNVMNPWWDTCFQNQATLRALNLATSPLELL